MSAVCPNGHTSDSEDYCDTCGAPIPEGAVTPGAPEAPEPSAGLPPPSPDGTASAGPAPGSPAPAATPNSLDLPPVGGGGPKECPNCQTVNAEGSLFCEACGYDFTTGAMPAGVESPAPPEAEAEVSEPEAEGSSYDPGGVPPRIAFQWVAEVWIDPDWYADQQANDPLPSAGLPVVVPLRVASALVGRRSASRNINPDIDCSADPGVSRRHAQLTTDGSRWFVEDLQSSNGTFVGPASGPLPDDPIAVGPKTEVGDNRVYVGAWTRIVVRRATDEEIAEG